MTDKPHMTLPNGDIIREGDYARTRSGRRVGPIVPSKCGPFRAIHSWQDADEQSYTNDGHYIHRRITDGDDLVAKWHEVAPGPDPVAPPAKRRKWWIVGGKAFDSARQAKIAYPGSTPIKVKECKVKQ